MELALVLRGCWRWAVSTADALLVCLDQYAVTAGQGSSRWADTYDGFGWLAKQQESEDSESVEVVEEESSEIWEELDQKEAAEEEADEAMVEL